MHYIYHSGPSVLISFKCMKYFPLLVPPPECPNPDDTTSSNPDDGGFNTTINNNDNDDVPPGGLDDVLGRNNSEVNEFCKDDNNQLESFTLVTNCEGGTARIMLVELYVKFVRRVWIRLYDKAGGLIDQKPVGLTFVSDYIYSCEDIV